MRPLTKLFLSLIVPVVLLLLPADFFPIENLSSVEQRFIALFAMAVFFWVLEPIPVFATSVLIVALQLVALSNAGFVLLRQDSNGENLPSLLDYKLVMASFGSPIIFLFLGGFFLAMAATKYRLDINLARILLRPFGTNPKFVLLGLMSITAVFSMFMSNTATTAMMLAILAPILLLFDKDDPGRIAFTLAVPVAANIGGIGTPIGTPPNAVGLKYLNDLRPITFSEWMAFGVPFVLLLLAFSWFLLIFLFPARKNEIEVNIKGAFQKNWRAVTVYVTFVGTVLLWLFDFLHGMNSYVVAFIPVAVFTATKIVTAEDLKRMSWDVLWLIAGGIALGVGLDKSGTAAKIVSSIPFSALSPIAIVLLGTLITYSVANFMSNTATANLLLPIVAAVGAGLQSLLPYGGGAMLVLAVTFSASLSMCLPISTPPNALAFASGQIKTRDMLKVGLIVGGVGLLGVYAMIMILNGVGFF